VSSEDADDLANLLRRFEEGERNPELLNRMNQAAWDQFHDPWETKPDLTVLEWPEFPDDDAPDAVPESFKGAELSSHLGVPTVQCPGEPVQLGSAPTWIRDADVSRRLIVHYLRRRSLEYWSKAQGGYLVCLGYAKTLNRSVLVQVGHEGHCGPDLGIQVSCDRRIEPAAFETARHCCDGWNEERLSRARLDFPEGSSAQDALSGVLLLTHKVRLSADLPQADFDQYMDEALAESWEFWKRAYLGHSL